MRLDASADTSQPHHDLDAPHSAKQLIYTAKERIQSIMAKANKALLIILNMTSIAQEASIQEIWKNEVKTFISMEIQI